MLTDENRAQIKTTIKFLADNLYTKAKTYTDMLENADADALEEVEAYRQFEFAYVFLKSYIETEV